MLFSKLVFKHAFENKKSFPGGNVVYLPACLGLSLWWWGRVWQHKPSSLSGLDCTSQASLQKGIIYSEISVLSIVVIVFETSRTEFCKNLVSFHSQR